MKNPRYNKFEKALAEYPIGTTLSLDDLFILINRVTWSSKKKFFGYSENIKFNARLKYYRHFIIIAEKKGFLKRIDIEYGESKFMIIKNKQTQ